jgi:hypothetical protein
MSTEDNPEVINHRGRIQAQGKKLEESERWAQFSPLSLKKGIGFSIILEERLSTRAKLLRKEAFEKCREFMIRSSENGGCPVTTKTFLAEAPHERVDIEVRLGIAFVKMEDES